MEYLVMIGIAIVMMIALQFTREKDILRVNLGKVAEFLAFMVIVNLIRLFIIDFSMQTGLMEQLPRVPSMILENKWTLGLVFWEDMLFGVPIYLASKYVQSKWIKWPLIVALSLSFGMGHAYQGMYGVAITSLYPWFISKRYGEKHGFGTVMLCHIMYDAFTTFLLVMLPYLLR